jgi:hypothetical protein
LAFGKSKSKRSARAYLSKRAEEEELRHDRVDEHVVQPQLLLPTLCVRIVPWLVVPFVQKQKEEVRCALTG